ncbi:MAG: hypothetical protein SVX43_00315 [Cyanobacteriota bacterium]|nr:hypothetical protein [Cyanobacteriota bacterium]
MLKIEKQFVTDETMQPVAVIISYQDWQKIEHLLEPYLTQPKTEPDRLNASPCRRGRAFPEKKLSPEGLARDRAESEAFLKRCHLVFDRVQPKLIQNHYNWFIVIEPDSGDYFVDPDKEVARAKASERYPDKECLIMQINETGACGNI